MEWPHNPDGDEGSEGGRVYGQAVFAKKVDPDTDFPLEFDEFEQRIGHHPIRIDSETIVPAADILAEVDAARAPDMVTFHQLVGQAMRRGGYWTYAPPTAGRGT